MNAQQGPATTCVVSVMSTSWSVEPSDPKSRQKNEFRLDLTLRHTPCNSKSQAIIGRATGCPRTRCAWTGAAWRRQISVEQRQWLIKVQNSLYSNNNLQPRGFIGFSGPFCLLVVSFGSFANGLNLFTISLQFEVCRLMVFLSASNTTRTVELAVWPRAEAKSPNKIWIQKDNRINLFNQQPPQFNQTSSKEHKNYHPTPTKRSTV